MILAAVAFDGGEGKVAAAGATLARKLREPLLLLHVADPEPAFVGYDTGVSVERHDVADAMRSEHHALHDLAEGVRHECPSVTALMVRGVPAEKIVAEAEKHGVGHIVMGQHRHGPMWELVVGGVTHDVLKHAHCLVTLVPIKP